MLTQVLVFLIETVAGFFTVLLLLRFLMQWARAGRNPVADFVNAFTNFVVVPLRRVVPGLWGLDLSTLILAWLVQFLEILLVRAVVVGSDVGGAMLLAVQPDRAAPEFPHASVPPAAPARDPDRRERRPLAAGGDHHLPAAADRPLGGGLRMNAAAADQTHDASFGKLRTQKIA
jgi:uncharacterized protein YggT (Ycf19 family)